MRTSSSSTPNLTFYPWPTPARTQMVPNSSLPLLSPPGSITRTSSSVRNSGFHICTYLYLFCSHSSIAPSLLMSFAICVSLTTLPRSVAPKRPRRMLTRFDSASSQLQSDYTPSSPDLQMAGHRIVQFPLPPITVHSNFKRFFPSFSRPYSIFTFSLRMPGSTSHQPFVFYFISDIPPISYLGF